MIQSIFQLFGFNINPIRAVESLSLALAWGWAGLVLTLLVLLPVTWALYRFEGKNIKPRQKWLLLSLRFVWVFLLAFLLTGPVITVSGLIPQRNRLAVMVDSSRSMGIKANGVSRLEIIEEVFSTKNFIDRLEGQTGIYPDVFSFAEHVSPVSRQEVEQFSFAAKGNQTDLSTAMQDVVANFGAGNLLGIIMLTDGVPTMGENPLITAANSRTPLYFVSPGTGSENVDLALSLSRPPAIGYLNSSVRVHGEVVVHNIATSAVDVQVYRDGQPFTVARAEFADQANRASFAFNIPCEEEGSYRFDLSVAELDDELTHENNHAGFLLRVVRERLNVLAISGRPNWDIKFIGNALSTDANAHFKYWLKVRNDRWLMAQDQQPEIAVKSPKLAEDLADTDVLLLSGVHYNDLKGLEKTIVNRIETGAMGVLILPSNSSFYQLGYADTELEKILPVKIGNETWRGTTGNMRLPSVDVPYNFLRILDDPIENLEFFSTLPQFDGLFEYESISPGAEVLVTSSVRGQQGLIPFMLRSRFGQGNLVLITGAPLWTTGFRLVPSVRGVEPYIGFIVNMFKWLANRREDAQVSIELPAARGYVGQGTNIRVWVMDSQNKLLSNAQVSMEVTGENDSKTSLNFMETSEQGSYEAVFVPAYRGVHKLEAVARHQGSELGRAEAELLVEMPTAEFDNPTVDFALMQRIASETGGLAVEAADADRLIRSIEAVPGQKIETKLLDVRDSWLLLLLLLVLPMVEWFLRRTGGLS